MGFEGKTAQKSPTTQSTTEVRHTEDLRDEDGHTRDDMERAENIEEDVERIRHGSKKLIIKTTDLKQVQHG